MPQRDYGKTLDAVPTEHQEQVCVIDWASLNKKKHPALRWLFAVPNGAHKSRAAALKFQKEGLKPGVSDLFLPEARGGYNGLFEMKRVNAKPSDVKPLKKSLCNLWTVRIITCEWRRVRMRRLRF